MEPRFVKLDPQYVEERMRLGTYPEWANYTAIDYSGMEFYYEYCPMQSVKDRTWYRVKGKYELKVTHERIFVDWKDTVRKIVDKIVNEDDSANKILCSGRSQNIEGGEHFYFQDSTWCGPCYSLIQKVYRGALFKIKNATGIWKMVVELPNGRLRVVDSNNPSQISVHIHPWDILELVEEVKPQAVECEYCKDEGKILHPLFDKNPVPCPECSFRTEKPITSDSILAAAKAAGEKVKVHQIVNPDERYVIKNGTCRLSDSVLCEENVLELLASTYYKQITSKVSPCFAYETEIPNVSPITSS